MPLDSDRPPRVVVLHKSELERKDGTQEIWQQIWDKFETMSREESPEYELSCDYLLHDDLAMVFLVKECRPTGAGMTEDEREFWSLPAGSENRCVCSRTRLFYRETDPSLCARLPQVLSHRPQSSSRRTYPLQRTTAVRVNPGGRFPTTTRVGPARLQQPQGQVQHTRLSQSRQVRPDPG